MRMWALVRGREVGLPFPWACQCWMDKDSSSLRHTWDLDQGEQEPLFCHHTNTLGPASPGLGKAATFYDVLPTHIHARPPLGVEGRRVGIPWGNLGWGWQWSQGGGLEGRTVLAQGASGQRVGGQESILGRQGWGTGRPAGELRLQAQYMLHCPIGLHLQNIGSDL